MSDRTPPPPAAARAAPPDPYLRDEIDAFALACARQKVTPPHGAIEIGTARRALEDGIVRLQAEAYDAGHEAAEGAARAAPPDLAELVDALVGAVRMSVSAGVGFQAERAALLSAISSLARERDAAQEQRRRHLAAKQEAEAVADHLRAEAGKLREERDAERERLRLATTMLRKHGWVMAGPIESAFAACVECQGTGPDPDNIQHAPVCALRAALRAESPQAVDCGCGRGSGCGGMTCEGMRPPTPTTPTLPPEIVEILRDVATEPGCMPDIRGRAGAALVRRDLVDACRRCGGSGYERIGDGSVNAWGPCEVCRPSPEAKPPATTRGPAVAVCLRCARPFTDHPLAKDDRCPGFVDDPAATCLFCGKRYDEHPREACFHGFQAPAAYYCENRRCTWRAYWKPRERRCPACGATVWKDGSANHRPRPALAAPAPADPAPAKEK